MYRQILGRRESVPLSEHASDFQSFVGILGPIGQWSGRSSFVCFYWWLSYFLLPWLDGVNVRLLSRNFEYFCGDMTRILEISWVRLRSTGWNLLTANDQLGSNDGIGQALSHPKIVPRTAKRHQTTSTVAHNHHNNIRHILTEFEVDRSWIWCSFATKMVRTDLWWLPFWLLLNLGNCREKSTKFRGVSKRFPD